MAELTQLRQLNSKTIQNPDGSFVLEAHAGHIHYQDKFGDGSLKPISFDLTWDSGLASWTFSQHSFQPVLPESADQWVGFRDVFAGKDQYIEFRPIAAHIKGVWLPFLLGVTDAPCVLYLDAFGTGKDLILCFGRST